MSQVAMTNKNDISKEKEAEIAEPPPLIKQIEWLLNRQHWERYWKAILLAFFFIFLTSFFSLFIGKFPEKIFSNSDGQQFDTLHKEQIRYSITKALHAGNVKLATTVLSRLSQSDVKRRECQHVFDYSIKHQRFDDASLVVNQCWLGDEKNEKLAELNYKNSINNMRL